MSINTSSNLGEYRQKINSLEDNVSSLENNLSSVLETGTGKNIFNLIYPVGAIYLSTSNISPSQLFGGEWSLVTEGTFLMAQGTNYPVNSTGGEATHILTVNEMPTHGDHLYSPSSYSSLSGRGNLKTMYINTSANMSNAGNELCRSWNVFSGNEAYPDGETKGGSQPHNNLPPYLAVYMWIRTA